MKKQEGLLIMRHLYKQLLITTMGAVFYTSAVASSIQSISIAPQTATVPSRMTKQYRLTVTYDDGTTAVVNNEVTWKSSNPSVATINSDGKATVVATSGQTEITASYDNLTSPAAKLTVSSSQSSTPFSCIEDPVTGNYCGCLSQNNGSGLIWYADGRTVGKWLNWGTGGYDLSQFNRANHCGYSDWHLPSVFSTKQKEFRLNAELASGDWGSLVNHAVTKGWDRKKDTLATWLNQNKFIGIESGFYWASLKENSVYIWGLDMFTGVTNQAVYTYPYGRVILVRGSNQ